MIYLVTRTNITKNNGIKPLEKVSVFLIPISLAIAI